MNYFANRIKESISMIDVCKYYGITVNRAGFAICPFHGEKTASFKAYPGSRGWICFGCGEHGDIIDFIQKYFNLKFNDALKKLNADFHIGLPIDGKQSFESQQRIAEIISKQKTEYEEYTKRKNIAICEYYDALNRFTVLDKAITDGEDNALYWEAMKKIDGAKYNLDIAEIRLRKITDERR